MVSGKNKKGQLKAIHGKYTMQSTGISSHGGQWYEFRDPTGHKEYDEVRHKTRAKRVLALANKQGRFPSRKQRMEELGIV